VHFLAVWYISPRFGTFLPVLVCCAKKNLATLVYKRLHKMLFVYTENNGYLRMDYPNLATKKIGETFQ
jgi:hypothetical protein